MKAKQTKLTFDIHAVKRIVERRLPVDAVAQIAEVGVTVQESRDCVMKRGDINGKPVHVVLVANSIRTVYTADQWDSTITIHRKKVSNL